MNIPEFLRAKVSLFKDISDEHLQELLNGSRTMSFEANEAIAHYGDKALHFGVVLSGKVSASVIGDAGTRQVLGHLGAGSTFGELALMTGDTLLADFTAEEPTQVLQIPVSLFQSIIMVQPGAVQQISRTLMERLRQVAAEPSRAVAALRKSDDPYGLKLKGERPEKLLVINCGSSSVKYTFYDTADESRQARGMVERIGIPGTRLAHHGPKGELKRELPSGGFAEAFAAMLEALTSKEKGVIGAAGDVSVVVHRVVHGGERFAEATVITDDLVRVDPNFALAMHIDTDEGNAANLQTGAQGYIEGIQDEG